MGKVRIVTDSTADLAPELVDELGIIVVPLKVSFGREVYRDGVDISSEEFIRKMGSETVHPTTSQPSPGEFVAVYERLMAKGESVISIHISGKLSGTVQSANTARAMTGSRDIYIVDSRSASMGLGLLVLAAARAARDGRHVREVLAVVKEKIEKTSVMFLVDSLEHLEKGGRIGKAGALLGTLLKIKPILAVDESGQVVPLERVRGRAKAIERISHIISERIDRSKRYNCAFVYGSDYTGIIALREKVLPVINAHQVYTTLIGPVIMAHTGPQLAGIALCPE